MELKTQANQSTEDSLKRSMGLWMATALEYVIVAFGSGSTMDGLVAHLGAERVIGIDPGAAPDARTRLVERLDGMPGASVRREDLQIDGDDVGAGDAALTKPAREAMMLASHSAGTSSIPPTRRVPWLV